MVSADGRENICCREPGRIEQAGINSPQKSIRRSRPRGDEKMASRHSRDIREIYGILIRSTASLTKTKGQSPDEDQPFAN